MASAADVGTRRRAPGVLGGGGGHRGARPDHQADRRGHAAPHSGGSRWWATGSSSAWSTTRAPRSGCTSGPYSRWIFLARRARRRVRAGPDVPQRARRRPASGSSPSALVAGGAAGNLHRPDPQRRRAWSTSSTSASARSAGRPSTSPTSPSAAARSRSRSRSGGRTPAARAARAGRPPRDRLTARPSRVVAPRPPSASTGSSPTSSASPARRPPGWSPTGA